MAELVKLNMEQMLPFFDELNNVVDSNKLREICSKIQHHEYKIASKVRKFEDFELYIDDLSKYYSYLKSLKLADSKAVIAPLSKLMQRIIKQITIHFQSDPKSFCLAIRFNRQFKDIMMETFYWEQFLLKHGHKNVNIYLAATRRFTIDIIRTMKSNHDRKLEKKKRLLPSSHHGGIKEIELEAEEKRRIIDMQVSHLLLTREIFDKAMREYPRHAGLLYNYLKFELMVSDVQQSEDGDCYRELGECADGRVVEIILRRMLSYFPEDKDYLRNVVDLIDAKMPNQNLPSMVQIRAIAGSRLQIIAVPEDLEVAMETTEEPDTVADAYETFLGKYEDPRVLRAAMPHKGASADLTNYLEGLRIRLDDGRLAKDVEIPRVRALLNWVLSCDDWSSVALDVWWQYYLLETAHGDFMKAHAVLQQAQDHLRNPDDQTHLRMRILKRTLGK